MKNLFRKGWLWYLLLISILGCTNRIPFTLQGSQTQIETEAEIIKPGDLTSDLRTDYPAEIKNINQKSSVPKHSVTKGFVRKETTMSALPIKAIPAFYSNAPNNLIKKRTFNGNTGFQILRILVLLYLIAALIIAIFINLWLGLLMFPILIFLLPFISYLLYGEFNLIIIIFLILGDGKIGG